jgi:threonine aldolase
LPLRLGQEVQALPRRARLITVRHDFYSDNTSGAAPEAMDALVRANSGFERSYGADSVTARAADLVRQFLDADAEVRFLGSGTAANAVTLAALCRPFEAVCCHQHAHVRLDEAGAPVFYGSGLGMIGLPGEAGLIDPAALVETLAMSDGASVQSPAALSLTNATEYGAVYTEAAMRALIEPAKAAGLGVHLDGARLANAWPLFDPKAAARLGVDILVLGGAKAGMTPTEAVVIFNRDLARRFDARLKQTGQLPSKSRFLAAPFVGMLEDGALLRHAEHANAMARKLAALSPFPIRHAVQSNAIFVDMDEVAHARLGESGWMVDRMWDDSVRFVASWATTDETVEEFAAALKAAA